ncbi:MAG: FliI/YscN family ATPase [Bdellovibrionales bacterium]|nr:FliI/YscN family ATPase [Bdellovibrionales bacterium]
MTFRQEHPKEQLNRRGLATLAERIPSAPPFLASGEVSAVSTSLVSTALEEVRIGDLCFIDRKGESQIPAEVISFSDRGALLAPFDSVQGIGPRATVTTSGSPPVLKLPPNLEGGIYDCLGNDLLNSGSQERRCTMALPLELAPPPPLTRTPITEKLITGIRAIDTCCPIGYGQRVGLFAGPGVGKSTLLGMIARTAQVDRVVVALVGERGREVKEFVEEILGPDGRRRSVVIVSTSDEKPVRRKLAPFTATRIAEFYRDRGERVLLLVDSLTRTARAIRDLSLIAGELPVRQGYTSSVFDQLPRLIERAGTLQDTTITDIYTILTSYDDTQDILSEEAKSLLDGHFVLSRELAEQGVYPAIDLTCSVSRLADKLHRGEEGGLAGSVLSILSRLKRDKDLAILGGRPDRELQRCLDLEPNLENFLSQGAQPDLETAKQFEQLRRIVGGQGDEG